MHTPLYQLIYRSRAAHPFTPQALGALLRTSRQRNQEHYLTGILLYADDEFMQVLEGHEPVLSALYERIKADPRHTDVQLLAYGKVGARCFPDWRMGYATVSSAQFERATGFLPLAQTPGLTAHPSAMVAQLLRTFAQASA